MQVSSDKRTHRTSCWYSLFCLICDKPIPVEHQGKADSDKQCTSKKHVDLCSKTYNTTFHSNGFRAGSSHFSTKVKVTGFLAEHNLPFATTDHLVLLFRSIFSDLKIAIACACGKTKALCILNRAIVPELQETLVKQIKAS